MGILTAIATTPGRVYSRLELLNRVRGYEFASERAVDSHVKNLRRKIKGDPRRPQIVETVLGRATALASRVTGRRLLSPLGIRLAAAFVTVAVAAVAVLAALTLASAHDEVSSLVRGVHERDTAAAAAAAGRAYEQAGGWDSADLTSAAAVAARGQASRTLRDDDGDVLPAPAHEATEMMARIHGVAIVDVPRGEPVLGSVVVGGRQVGTVELRFPTSHLPTRERQIRDALSRNALLGAGLAIVSAMAVAVFVARRVSRPITALTVAASHLEAGRRDSGWVWPTRRES